MMSAKALTVGIIGAGCIAAAGIGGYLAARGSSPAEAAAPAAPRVAAAVPAPELPPPTAPGVDPGHEAPPSRLGAVQAPPPTTQATNQRAAVRPNGPNRAPTAARPSDSSSAEPAPASDPSESEDRLPSGLAPTDASTPVIAGPVLEGPPPLPAVADPAPPAFDEVTIAENGVIGIELQTPVSSDTAKIEDRISARVTRDVTVDGRVAIPAGSAIEGVVTLVERGGRFRERARLGIQFTDLVVEDAARVSIQTEPIYRTGEPPSGEAATKISAGAVIGGVLGAVIGGKKGAAIGGTAGAAGGTAAVMASGPNHVMLVSGTALTVRLTEPVSLAIPRLP